MQIGSKDGFMLLADKDTVVLASSKKALEKRGFAVQIALSLRAAREILGRDEPRCVSLEMNMPDGSGLGFLAEFRKMSSVPVLLLAAFATSSEIISALDAGADDFLAKPYDQGVFGARMAALARRAQLVPDKLSIGPIVLDNGTSRALFGGKDLGLQQKEFVLLRLFAQRPGQIVSHEFLHERVWGFVSSEASNNLKVAVSKLRASLAETGYTITASKGEGYYLEEV